jgi:hypothetical protein
MSDPTKVSRRLVAVFAADVEGYSRLMGADEVGTLKGLTERRAILDILREPRGRPILGRNTGGICFRFGGVADIAGNAASFTQPRIIRKQTTNAKILFRPISAHASNDLR